MEDNKELMNINEDDTLIKGIIKETDPDKLKHLTSLFNLNQSKKNLVRADKFQGLLDSICEQMITRFNANPYTFENKELIDWLNTVQNTIDKTEKYSDAIDNAPSIAFQQNNQVNVTIGSDIDQDSRDRIVDTIKNILKLEEKT